MKIIPFNSFITIFTFLFSLSLSAQNKVGQFANFSLKIKDLDILEYRADIGAFNKSESTYLLHNIFSIPFFGKKELKRDVKELILNDHTKSNVILLSCRLIKGEIVKLNIDGKDVKACKLDISFLSDETKHNLYKLKILRKKLPLKGTVYMADVPVWGIAKIETKYVSLNLMNFKW
jgi:hypothetical protein